MTCIVALSDNDMVYMGGDRSYSDGHNIIAMQEPKIFTRDQWLFGYAGNIGIGQAIAHNFSFPYVDEPHHIYTVFIPALRKFIKKLGVEIKGDDDSLALLGVLGMVYELNLSDFQCVPIKEGAIGVGSAYAFGSLYSTQSLFPEERVQLALRAAIHYSPNCSTPIDILKM